VKQSQERQSMKKYLCIGIFTGFLAGLIIGNIHGKQSIEAKVFTSGYDAAMNHVRQTIEAKLPALVPFYMADLGIKFIPRGHNIVAVKYVSHETKGVIAWR
jgi:hypothetical protein